jgi:hypothetical protein
MAREFKYQLIDHIADIGEVDGKGWGIEINIICFGNSKKPVIDIRKWNRETDTMGKGITLSLEVFKEIQKVDASLLEDFFEKEDNE